MSAPVLNLTSQTDAVLAKYPALDLNALMASQRPEREWTVFGLIPSGASCSIIAPAGAGKSLLALGIVLHVATGRQSFAGLPIPRPRTVLYIDAENTEDDLYERLIDFGVTTDTDLHRLQFLHLPTLPALDTPNGGAELADIVRAYKLQRGDLVVLDSFQRVTEGKENDSDTMRAFYRYTGQGLKRDGLSVLRLDNTGKELDRGARGSSGKRDDVDIAWIMTPSGDKGETITLALDKQRIPDVRTLRLQRQIDGAGHLRYTTAGDPQQQEINRVISILTALGLPKDAGVKPCGEALRADGHKASAEIVRAAVKARKSVPNPSGIPPLDNRADPAPAHLGTPTPDDESQQVNTGKECAES